MGSLGVELREVWKNPGRLREILAARRPASPAGARLGLVREATNTVALGLALGLLSGAVLLALAVIEGVSTGCFRFRRSPRMFACWWSFRCFLVRIVVGPSIEGLCQHDRAFRGRAREYAAGPGFEIARTVRWKNAWLPEECACWLPCCYRVCDAVTLSGKTAALDPTRALSDVPLADLWYWIVCLPLFRFLIFRWIWRIALWWRSSGAWRNWIPPGGDSSRRRRGAGIS